MNEPLVSVIVDNYNYARFLPDAIDSALRQTYGHVEVIVVDDGSTDGSRDVIASYGTRIRAVLKRNGGQGSAFNAGLEIARGKLIALLDSDDTFLPDKVARCVRAASGHPTAGLIYHRVQMVDADGKPLRRPYPQRVYSGSIVRKVRSGGGIWQYPPTSGLLFRREFLERILPFPEDLYRTSADSYVACLAGLMTDVAGIEDVLTCYRLHGSNAWMSADGGTEDQKLHHYITRSEVENRGLNEALERFGSPLRVSLDDNFVYQIWLRQAGRGTSIRRILELVVCDSSEMWVRIKTVVSTISTWRWSTCRDVARRSEPVK